MIAAVVALGSGFVFAVGLALSGMTQPSKVIGFLDLTGRWDPSLALVMVGAIAVYAVAHKLGARMRKPLAAQAFAARASGGIDRRLLLGSAVFGVGWGLAGYCPGPAFAASATGAAAALLFTAAMLIGFWITRLVDGRRNAQRSLARDSR